MDSLVVFLGHLEVDWRLRDGLGGEADVEPVLAQGVVGEALVAGVVSIVHRLYGQHWLPGAVANLKQALLVSWSSKQYSKTLNLDLDFDFGGL